MVLETAFMCLALNVYFEARGEPLPGQYAVAFVTMNRAVVPERVCKVVLERHQFSWTTSKVVKSGGRYRLRQSAVPKDKAAWQRAKQVANRVLRGKQDTTRGATHYHASYVQPRWAARLPRIKRIGAHIFYRCPVTAKSAMTILTKT